MRHARGTALVTVASEAAALELYAWLYAHGLRAQAARLCFLWGARVTTHGVFRLRGA